MPTVRDENGRVGLARRYRKTRLVFAPILVGLFALLVAPAVANTPVSGQWVGEAGFPAYPVELKVKRNLDIGEPGGKTVYTSFPCEGKLIFKRRQGERFHFREKLTEGIENCANRGLVRLKRSGDDLKYNWSKGDSVDEGLLSRAE